MSNDFKKRIVHSLIEIDEEMSLSQISSGIGVSVPTSTKYISDMVEDGLVVKVGKTSSSQGRRPFTYRLNRSAVYFVGVLPKDNSLGLSLMNLVGGLEYEKTIDIDNCGTEESLELICVEVQKFIRESGVPSSKIKEICFGISGRVNVTTGESYSRYNSENIDEPLADWLSNRLGIRTIIENDTRTMALAELKAINGKYKDFLFVNASWGIGMSIVIEGKIYHGMNGFSGELGHTNIYDNEIICRCGKKGCLETVASGRAICSQLKTCIGQGKNSILAERIKRGDEIREGDIVNAALRDDSLSIDLIEKAGAEIGRQVANLINIFNPEAVIIGGSLTEVGEIFIQSIKLAAKKYCLRLLLKDVDVVQSVLRSKADRLGTCLEAREDYIDGAMFWQGSNGCE